MSWIRDNLKIVVPVTLVTLVGIGFLAFGVFGVQFLFIDDTVDEAAPVFDSGIAANELTPPADSSIAVETTVAETTAPATIAPATTAAPPPPAALAPQTTAPPTTVAPTTVPPTTVPATTVPATTGPPVAQIVTLVQGSFIPRDHRGEGTALVLGDGSSQRFLRFENFATDNGPDLNVYLTTTDAAGEESTFDDDFVDLGNLKGNIGEQNYEIPPDVDLSVYNTVVVWCVRFDSAFTAADLASA